MDDFKLTIKVTKETDSDIEDSLIEITEYSNESLKFSMVEVPDIPDIIVRKIDLERMLLIFRS